MVIGMTTVLHKGIALVWNRDKKLGQWQGQWQGQWSEFVWIIFASTLRSCLLLGLEIGSVPTKGCAYVWG